jgi:GNAT superfamily N-acetyltransferase
VKIRALDHGDPPRIAGALAALGWNKPVEQYDGYLTEQAAGVRAVLVAELDGGFAGYLTVLWSSPYPPFREHGVPELQDLNVLPALRRRGVGTALMDAAEALAGERADLVGIGVGMDPDYGPAQAMYVRRGYVPDARGLTSHGRHVAWGDTVKVDDDLVLYFTKALR